MDVPSPHAGQIQDIKISVGDKVSEGDTILTIKTTAREKKEGETAEKPKPEGREKEGGKEAKEEDRASPGEGGERFA